LTTLRGRPHHEFEQINTAAQKRYREAWRQFKIKGDSSVISEPGITEYSPFGYIDEVLQQQDISLVESVQRGMRTPAFDQGRIVYDPHGSGLSEHGVHHFHGLVLDAYRALVGLTRDAEAATAASASRLR
jgi:hypothetical protein